MEAKTSAPKSFWQQKKSEIRRSQFFRLYGKLFVVLMLVSRLFSGSKSLDILKQNLALIFAYISSGIAIYIWYLFHRVEPMHGGSAAITARNSIPKIGWAYLGFFAFLTVVIPPGLLMSLPYSASDPRLRVKYAAILSATGHADLAEQELRSILAEPDSLNDNLYPDIEARVRLTLAELLAVKSATAESAIIAKPTCQWRMPPDLDALRQKLRVCGVQK